MKVKNKRIILSLFLAILIALLGISIYTSNVNIYFYSDEIDAKFPVVNLQKFTSSFDFNGYYRENQKYIDVEHYNLVFELIPEKELLKGEVTITGKLLKPVDEIHLNFYDNFSIESVRLNGYKIDYTNIGTDLTISNKNEKESFEITIKYSGKPVDLGFGSFIFGDLNGRTAVHSLSEPNYASTWFPCNDLTTDKALMDIYITNDSSKVSVSNGSLIDVITTGDKKTYHWKTYYPISTYLICIYSADYLSFNEDYISITGDTLKLVYYSFPEDFEDALIDMEDHKNYLSFMESTFGEYPFLKEKYGVAEFLWSSGAMEHQTITGFSFKYYTGNKFFSDVLIHELAHQWWGNAVTLQTWKDIWLNEGFAKYSEALYWEHSKGKNALQSAMQEIYGDFDDSPLYDPGKDLFSRKVYNKGAWTLHMLRREIGDDVFFEVLKTYYKNYKYKNASSIDFKDICEKTAKKNLDYFFNQWLFDGKGIISLRYNWSYENRGQIILSIKQTQKGYEKYNFPIDVLLQEYNKDELHSFYITSADTQIIFESSIEPDNIRLDPNGWLLAHIWEEKE